MGTEQLYEMSIQHFLSPIRQVLDDPSVTEIMINGPDCVRVERAGCIQQTSLRFPGEASLNAAAINIAEFNSQEIGAKKLTMDGVLPDGTRIHIVFPPAVAGGIHMTIRKFRKVSFCLDDLISNHALSPDVAEYLSLCVQMKRNILVSGGTGTGKTSFLNALMSCIPQNERLVTIEDTPELSCSADQHVVSLIAANASPESRLTIRELFANALRMRPDRIIVGEVRRGEALDLVQSMLSGHGGALGTVHGGNAIDAVIRMETLCLMNDLQMPIHVARQQVAAAVHVIVQLIRTNTGHRCVQSISECRGLQSDGSYDLKKIFQLKTFEGTHQFEWTGNSSSFGPLAETYGMQQRIQQIAQYFD